MCGRFGFSMVRARAMQEYALVQADEWDARKNVAPGTGVAAIFHDATAGGRVLRVLRWGLVPAWAKDEKIGYRMINARSETAHEKPSFRDAFSKRRCLIPAELFYEWQKTGSGKNQTKKPWGFTADAGWFAMAGLWETWTGPGTNALYTCTILTTAPNELVAPVHDRMPVILPPETWDAWLGAEAATADDVLKLCGPYAADRMRSFEVSDAVNSPTNQDF